MKSMYQEKLRALNSQGFFSIATIELTSRCNLTCKYCYIAPTEKELSTVQVHDAIDRLADAGVVSILFTGGEVFLRDDFIEILTHTFEKKFFQTFILSNGTFLRKEHIDFISSNASNFGYIRFSFFSHIANVHDAFTGIQGSFEQALANAEMLKNNKIKMHVIINLTEDNVETMAETKAFFLSKGFCVREGHVKMITNDRTKSCCTPLTTKPFFSRYFGHCSDTIKDTLRKSLENNCIGKPAKVALCEKLFGTIAILAGGEIVPCISFRDVSIGNITTITRPLQEIFRESTLLRQLRTLRRTELVPCKTCKFINYCFFCPGMMHSEHGSYGKPQQQSCNYTQALYETIHS